MTGSVGQTLAPLNSAAGDTQAATSRPQITPAISTSSVTQFRCRTMSPEERAAWEWTVNPQTELAKLAYLLARWRVDPVLFAVEALRVALMHYQIQILLDLADAPIELYEFYGADPYRPKRQVLAPSGHGLGKTRGLAIAGWWHLLTHRFSKTLYTAPTSDQLTGGVWGELRKMYRRLKKAWPMLAAEWEILGSSIVHVDPELGDWKLYARTARAEAPEGLQGAHALDDDDAFGDIAGLFGEDIDEGTSGGMLVIVEEASGVEDSIREVLEGALSEEGARFLAVGNPTRPDGWFAEDLDKVERYAVHALDCRMSDRSKIYSFPYRDFVGRVHAIRLRGFVRPEYWNAILADCEGDEDSDYFRVRVRGVKPRSAFDQCIKAHWLDAAEARAPHAESRAEPVVIGLDFGATSDKHGLGVRQGFNILDGEEWLPKDKPEEVTLDAAMRAIEAQKLYNGKFIVGDSNGVGRGAMEYLTVYYRDEHPELNVTVIHFNAGARAIDDQRYYLRRDEMWFKYGRKFFADQRTHTPKLPGLKKQLCLPGFHEDTKKKIRVESKDEIKKRTGEPSGNLADAILETLVVQIEVAKDTVKDEPAHPPVFAEHFKRWQRQRDQASGTYIQ